MGNSKLITLTLFYSTCRLLIQGFGSTKWIDSELQRLLACINHIRISHNTNFDAILNHSYPDDHNQPRTFSPTDDQSESLLSGPPEVQPYSVLTSPPDTLPVLTTPVDQPRADTSPLTSELTQAVISLPDDDQPHPTLSSMGEVQPQDPDESVHEEISFSMDDSPTGSLDNLLNLEIPIDLIEELRSELSSAKEAAQLLKADNDHLSRRLQNKDSECSALKEEIAQLKTKLKEQSAFQQHTKSLQKELDSVKEVAQLLKADNDHLSRILQNKDSDCSALKEENAQLKTKLMEQSASQQHKKLHDSTQKESYAAALAYGSERNSPQRRATSSTVSHQEKQKTIILGDSHSRSLAERMTDTTSVVNPGRQIQHIDTSVVKDHKQVVLIIGSNNIGSTDSIKDIDQKFTKLIKDIQTMLMT